MLLIMEPESNIICRGCLSVDRSLFPIKRNMDLFLILLGDNKLYSSALEEHVYLCFECNSLLRKVEMFRQRIKTAQDVLAKMLSLNWTPKKSLSQLTITKENDFSLITMEEQDVCKVKEEFNDSMSIDTIDCSNINLKEEISDIFEKWNENLDSVDTAKSESKQMSNVRKKCKISSIVFSDEEKDCFVVPTVMTLNELLVMPKKKNGIHYKNMITSCSRFVSKLGDLKNSDLKKKDKDEDLNCALCKKAITDQNHMICHWFNHSIDLYKCTLCHIYARRRREILQHISDWHTMVYQCKTCGFKFWKMPQFNKHYNNMHKYFFCDHCNRKFFSKSTIERHMRRNHLPLICHICFKEYKHLSHLRQHLASHEMAPTELTYCVECDLQFGSQYGYKRHLRTSVAHRPRKIEKIPCPDCDKIFSRKVYMNNHYKQVHTRKSQHYCELCDKFFINGYAIRTHKKFVHEKNVKPKNKICDVCNRGFHTNRVLINHRRTHTGERPFKCTYCSAAFAQDQAQKAHERTQHKNMFILNS